MNAKRNKKERITVGGAVDEGSSRRPSATTCRPTAWRPPSATCAAPSSATNRPANGRSPRCDKSNGCRHISPARQRKDIDALADRAGYCIVRWYEDHGLTGTESSTRKGFQKLLADAKSGAFRAVLLPEQSRCHARTSSMRWCIGSNSGTRA